MISLDMSIKILDEHFSSIVHYGVHEKMQAWERVKQEINNLPSSPSISINPKSGLILINKENP
jgi:hypothetical protein